VVGDAVNAKMLTLYPSALRKSTMIREMRSAAQEGWERAVEELEKVHAMFPACPTHGALKDPAIVIVGEGDAAQIGIVCPQCSGGEILAGWEKEGNLS
jgi:hypothetical protein